MSDNRTVKKMLLAAEARAIAARIAQALAEIETGRQAIAAIEAPTTFVDRVISFWGGRR